MRSLMMTVLLGALTVPAWAQDPGDAPEHGVARISAMSGDVTVRRGDSGEDVAAELNAPLVALDHVYTNGGARAEIQFDTANFLRLAPDSEVRLAELSDRDFLVQLSAGTLTFRVLRDNDSQAEISTPNISIRPREEGTYRITVHDDQSTEVTVRSGEAEIYVGGKSDRLRAGQTLMVEGDASDPDRRYVRAIPRDDWDRWNETRDRDRSRSDSYKYVDRHVYGAEDLYGYGSWVYDSPYGWVWVPRVSVSWAPYRVGRWVWVSYYGWTWVSGDPWGWAPYHYGRWYNTPRYGWVWYPGEPHVRYYWRPALVVFFGWGTGNVGWVPLAPREVYRPWYGSNRTVIVNNTTVVRNTTVVNNINVVNTYKNAHFVSGRNGVTSVNSGDFGRRNITINNYVVAKNHDLDHADHADKWLDREPSRENRQFSNRVAVAHKTSRPDNDRSFVSRPGRNNNSNNSSNQARGGDGRVQPNNSDDGRGRGNDSRRNDTVNAPRNDQERGRQPENNRGRGNESAGPQRDARVEPNNSDNGRRGNDSKRTETVTFPRNDQERGRQSDANRGRGNDSAGPQRDARVEPNNSDNGRRGNDSKRTETVTFPRNDQERGRQSDANRGRGNDSTGPQRDARVEPNNSDNGRRGNDSRRNETVTFPRNEPDRSRQTENDRGRGTSQPDTRVDNGRTGNNSGRNETVTFPRNEPDRGGRQSEPRVQSDPSSSNSRRAEEARREPVVAPRTERPQESRGRPGPSEESRRPEPAVRNTPSSGPSRSEPPRGRQEEVSRAPQRASENAPSASSGREQSRGKSAPQSSSSSSSGKGNSEESNGRGRDRDGR